jgi:hypothetical protein
MGLTKLSHDIQNKLPDHLPEFTWQRAVAAGSLVVSACMLLAGRRKSAVAIAAAGTAVALLENPEAARELWESVPGYLRKGQDFLVRVEDFVEEIAKQGGKLRNSIG